MFHDSSFKFHLNFIQVPVDPVVQFGSLFRFLWVSAGPTYSALPVNAKENSVLSVLDGNYYFIDVPFKWIFLWFMTYICFRFLYVLAEYFFTHPCFSLVFRYQLTMVGTGSSSLCWAHIYYKFFCHLELVQLSLVVVNPVNFFIVRCEGLWFGWLFI